MDASQMLTRTTAGTVRSKSCCGVSGEDEGWGGGGAAGVGVRAGGGRTGRAAQVVGGALAGAASVVDAATGRTVRPLTIDKTPWTVHHPPNANATNAPLKPSAVGRADGRRSPAAAYGGCPLPCPSTLITVLSA